MRIITLNANGLRSAARKGFYPWLARQRADLVCLQEIRAGEEQLDLGTNIKDARPTDWSRDGGSIIVTA